MDAVAAVAVAEVAEAEAGQAAEIARRTRSRSRAGSSPHAFISVQANRRLSMLTSNPHRGPRPAIVATLILLSILACGCADDPPPPNDGPAVPAAAAAPAPANANAAAPANAGTAFPTPKRTVEALTAAAKNSDTPAMLAIFGPDGRDILSSGDAVQDRRSRQVFVVAIDQRRQLEETADPARRELVIGNERWPFPVPLVRAGEGWRFDTDAGMREVHARRIGRNELAAIGICHTYVIAQKQYAAESRDGNPAGVYAQKVRSTPEKHDGLFWPAKPGEKRSPLGDLAAQAASEGYTGTPAGTGTGTAAPAQGPKPLRGYFFRILTQQGALRPRRRKSYLVNGQMTAGFALIAHPAEYGNSGIMTFIVNHEGVVHEADLGPATAKLAGAITAYDPDGRFRPVE